MNFYKNLLENLWEKKYRISQIDQAIYKDLVTSWDEITTLPSSLREQLQKFPIFPIKKLKEKKSEKDWTIKILFQTVDWHKIESVLMRHHNNRNTVCVSCQIGCAQKCTFCATWTLGLKRNLTSDEIIAQVLFFEKILRNEDQAVTNVVYMWMWEPFLNYDNVLDSIYALHHQKKFWLSARHITVSTSWIIPEIIKYTQVPLQLNLAISIHAWTDETRSKIMPVNLAYPLKQLIKALDDYQKKTKRKVFYEYVMLEWINDDLSEAVSLAKLIKWQIAHVNIIPFNSWAKEKYQCSSRTKMLEFQKVFLDYGIPSTIRVSLGQDIDGACGQLASKQ